MPPVLTRITKVIRQYEKCLVDERDFRDLTFNELSRALEEHDPEFSEAFTLIAGLSELSVEHFQSIVWLIQRAMQTDPGKPLSATAPHHELRDAVIGHVRQAIHGGNPEIAAKDLLVAAYLNPNLPPHTFPKIRTHLLEHSCRGSIQNIVALAVRLSIEHRDGEATVLARELASRDDLQPHHPAVLGMIVWLAGDRVEAIRLSDLSLARSDEFGWSTQASRSLRRFMHAADSEPNNVIDLLTVAEHVEQPGKSIATVGALVARMALMRMHAYLEMDALDWAGREALAVLAHHDYRGYDLHLQTPGFEFEAALVNRVAITPDEIVDAREIAKRLTTDPLRETPHLIEGSLRSHQH